MSGTSIQWATDSWNPIAAYDRETGKRGWFCTKVSEGCQNCYAEQFNRFRGNGHLYRVGNLDRVRFELAPTLDAPLHWRKPRRVFVNSMTDLFLEQHADEQIDAVFSVMAKARAHQFLVLTKRPARMLEYSSARLLGLPLPNVWLGVSVEHQRAADERIPDLLATPAAVRFLSCEPLLGPVDLKRFAPFIAHFGAAAIECKHGHDACPICDRGIDWVIVGGESGGKARPMNVDWGVREFPAVAHVADERAMQRAGRGR
jgi:protein gp37